MMTVYVDADEFLKILSKGESLIIKDLDGSRQTNVFSSTDRDFDRFRSVRKPTKETAVDVYELLINTLREDIFRSFGRDLTSLCLTCDQINEFCHTYEEWLQSGVDNIFLLKSGGSFFVVNVYLNGSREMRVGVQDLDSKATIWGRDYHHRIIVPKQTT